LLGHFFTFHADDVRRWEWNKWKYLTYFSDLSGLQGASFAYKSVWYVGLDAF